MCEAPCTQQGCRPRGGGHTPSPRCHPCLGRDHWEAQVRSSWAHSRASQRLQVVAVLVSKAVEIYGVGPFVMVVVVLCHGLLGHEEVVLLGGIPVPGRCRGVGVSVLRSPRLLLSLIHI